jgi:hypothetical protein
MSDPNLLGFFQAVHARNGRGTITLHQRCDALGTAIHFLRSIISRTSHQHVSLMCMGLREQAFAVAVFARIAGIDGTHTNRIEFENGSSVALYLRYDWVREGGTITGSSTVDIQHHLHTGNSGEGSGEWVISCAPRRLGCCCTSSILSKGQRHTTGSVQQSSSAARRRAVRSLW